MIRLYDLGLIVDQRSVDEGLCAHAVVNGNCSLSFVW